MKLKKYGKYIDEADAVIRFNGGPTTNGLSDYVGSKTTIRFLNTQHLGFHESKKEILLQHVTVEETMQKFINFKKRFNGDIYVIDGRLSSACFGHHGRWRRFERFLRFAFWFRTMRKLLFGDSPKDGTSPHQIEQNLSITITMM